MVPPEWLPTSRAGPVAGTFSMPRTSERKYADSSGLSRGSVLGMCSGSQASKPSSLDTRPAVSPSTAAAIWSSPSTGAGERRARCTRGLRVGAMTCASPTPGGRKHVDVRRSRWAKSERTFRTGDLAVRLNRGSPSSALAGEYLCQFSVLSEEGLTPVCDQLLAVAVVRVEAGPVVLREDAQSTHREERRLRQAGEAAYELDGVTADIAVHRDGDDTHDARLEDEQQISEKHDDDPHELASADCLVDVESHGLVLGFLEGVPGEDVAGCGAADILPRLLIGQDEFGEGGGVVLERCSEGQVHLLALDPLAHPVQTADVAVDAAGGIPVLGETFVEDQVLASVHLLLTDEPLNIGPQLRISDLVAHRRHRADEELLALGKRRRQHGEDVTHGHLAVGEVLRKVRDPLVELHRSHGNLRGPRRDLIAGWKVESGSAHVHPVRSTSS